MKFRALPAVEYLRERLDYDPSTGALLWRARPDEHFPDPAHANSWNTRYAGTPAGVISNGYLRIAVDDRVYMAHRIAWLMFYGSQVPNDIDHIDGNRSNNCISNLRPASRSENLANKRKQTTNSGVKGVWFDASRCNFMAIVTASGKRHFIGRFSTLEEATKARREAAERLHGEFARHE